MEGQPSEGIVKIRGLPYTATKGDVIMFFRGYGMLTDDCVHFVMGADGRPTGEGFVIFGGPQADVSGALSRDRHVLGNRYVELFTSTQEEMQNKLAGL